MTAQTTETSINFEMTLKATPAMVWKALTTPEGWSSWFSDDVDGDFNEGGILRINFGKYGFHHAIVCERVEEKSFAYRWHPGDVGELDMYPRDQMTTVRFELKQEGDTTKVTMTESGFERIPADRRKTALGNNSGGWEIELGELQAWVESDTLQTVSSDVIERNRTYKTTPAQLWEAVATAKGLCSWFCVRATGTFAKGEMVVLTFNYGREFDGPCKITDCDPGKSFTFQWHPGESQGCTWDKYPEAETTKVTVTVAPAPDGAHLHILESGFNAIPETRRPTCFDMNRCGWTEVMQMIATHLGDA